MEANEMTDGWEVLEKVVQTITLFEIVNQRLHGHARPRKDDHPAHDLL